MRIAVLVLLLVVSSFSAAQGDAISLNEWIQSYPQFLQRYVSNFRSQMLSTGSNQFASQEEFRQWRQAQYKALGRIQSLQDLAAPTLDLTSSPAFGVLPTGVGTFVERNDQFFIQGGLVERETRLNTGARREIAVPFELRIENVNSEHRQTLADNGVDSYFWELTSLRSNRQDGSRRGTVNLFTEQGLWRKVKARHKDLKPIPMGAIIAN